MNNETGHVSAINATKANRTNLAGPRLPHAGLEEAGLDGPPVLGHPLLAGPGAEQDPSGRNIRGASGSYIAESEKTTTNDRQKA